MKSLAKFIIGCGVYCVYRAACPARLRAVKNSLFASEGLSVWDRQLIYFLLMLIGWNTESASRYWSGQAGGKFHASAKHRMTRSRISEDDFYRRPMLDQFVRSSGNLLRPKASMIEIGCGAGGNILFVREQLRDRDFQFIGYDINEEVITSLQGSDFENVSFMVKDCFSSPLTINGDVGVISCAVLMYVAPEDIEKFLMELKRERSRRIVFGLSEPAANPDAEISVRHDRLAFLHGYRRMFQKHSFAPLFETTRQEPGKTAFIYHAVFELRP